MSRCCKRQRLNGDAADSEKCEEVEREHEGCECCTRANEAWKGHPRVAVVTGANSGLGFALVDALIFPSVSARCECDGCEDHKVKCSDLIEKCEPISTSFGEWRSTGFDKVFALVQRGGCLKKLEQIGSQRPGVLRMVCFDLLEEDIMETAARTISKETDHVDFLINNAAILTKPVPLRCMSSKRLNESLAVNSAGPIVFSRMMLPLIKKGKGKRIINVSSIAGSIQCKCGGQTAGQYEYKMSKAALNMGSCIMAQELKSANILVVAFNPGGVCTEKIKSFLGPRAHPAFGWMFPCFGARKLLRIVDVLCVKQHSGKFINHRYLDEDDIEYHKFLPW